MQRNDRWPDDYDPDETKSRPGSRRNSASLSRRSSKKEKEGKKKSPLNTTPNSVTSTPKKVVKPQNLEFMVTGKQCLKKCDRANSLPGYNRRPGNDAKNKKVFESPKRAVNASQSSKSRETSLEDDMSLDLSQVSDFEDTNSKYGIKATNPLATSTPKVQKTKPRSGSLQTHLKEKARFERDNTFSCSRESRDSVFKSSSSASPYSRYAVTEMDYSSVSPEYSGQSSSELSPRVGGDMGTPRSLEPQLSSCCGSSWQDCSEMENTAVDRNSGEWSDFWANYNSSASIGKVPVKRYYDQCPTPYRTENIDLADLEFSAAGSHKRSPDNIDNINYIIRNEGLHLTPRETQNMIKCAHILGNVLSKAIERRCKEKERDGDRIEEVKTEMEDPVESKKKTMTLDLKETNEPAVVEEEKRCETVTTQTDISLPNTKSAPRIFEKILRQLSRSSLEEGIKAMNMNENVNKGEIKEAKEDTNEEKKETVESEKQ